MAIFGPSGVGKTSLLKTLTAQETLCIDLFGEHSLLARRRQENSSQSNSLRDIPLDFSPKESVCRHEPTQGREGR